MTYDEEKYHVYIEYSWYALTVPICQVWFDNAGTVQYHREISMEFKVYDCWQQLE